MFNQSQPAEDRGLFLDKFASYLQGTGRYSADEATAVAATLLPDILTYDWATPSRFPNGRTLTDDVSDWMWALLTKGTAPNDGIGPHTDLISDFPYLGPPHMDASAEWQGGSAQSRTKHRRLRAFLSFLPCATHRRLPRIGWRHSGVTGVLLGAVGRAGHCLSRPPRAWSAARWPPLPSATPPVLRPGAAAGIAQPNPAPEQGRHRPAPAINPENKTKYRMSHRRSALLRCPVALAERRACEPRYERWPASSRQCLAS